MAISYASVGGKPYRPRVASFAQSGPIFDFGWIPLDDRTPEERERHEKIVSEMPDFRISGSTAYDRKRSRLIETWSNPTVAAKIGYVYPGVRQTTGCCVGAGGGNAIFSLIAAEVLRTGDYEKITVPFWLLTYGRSRYRGGMRGRGEGSFGSAFAEAIRLDGVIDAKETDLPRFENSNGLSWGSNNEMTWSDGGAISQSWMDKAKVHLVKTTAACKSADDVREALMNWYPVTIASMWGCDSPRVQGTPGVLLGTRNTSWSHQMSIHDWWEHPSLGEIFWIQNQWGLNAHGKCPSGMPLGGMWTTKADVDWICKTGEVFAFSQFDGFPEQEPMNWLI
jgi:hypothetical protein